MIGTCTACGWQQVFFTGFATILNPEDPEAWTSECPVCGALVLKDKPGEPIWEENQW